MQCKHVLKISKHSQQRVDEDLQRLLCGDGSCISTSGVVMSCVADKWFVGEVLQFKGAASVREAREPWLRLTAFMTEEKAIEKAEDKSWVSTLGIDEKVDFTGEESDDVYDDDRQKVKLDFTNLERVIEEIEGGRK